MFEYARQGTKGIFITVTVFTALRDKSEPQGTFSVYVPLMVNTLLVSPDEQYLSKSKRVNYKTRV